MTAALPKWQAMWTRKQWSGFFNLPKVNWSLFALGILLILGGLLITPLPGPGGIFLIAPGLAFVLKSSIWAKRHYVRIKKWQPRAGKWMDWSLRRKSAARREALRKAEKEAVVPPPGECGTN
jgi:hypothetical protein